MKKNRIIFHFAAAVFLTLPLLGYAKSEPKAKYVFYFIGDGMGIQHITATQNYLAGVEGAPMANKQLSFTTFPVTGFVQTYSDNRYITGSAAAGTALAAGYKTSVNTIGLAPNRIDTLHSIAYYAHNAGFNVGVATSVSVDHATPAAFYAHQPLRSNYHAISHDMIRAGYKFFAGGGFKDPFGKKTDNPQGNIFEKGQQSGFYFTNSLSVTDSVINSYKSIVYTLDKPASGAALKYQIDSNDDDVTLSQVTSMGIDILDSPNGFLFMVEGGKIDWAAHDNDAATVIHDVVALSDAVDIALQFYTQYPEQTLIVVTSDHETGGMSVGRRGSRYQSNVPLLAKQKLSLDQLNVEVGNFISRKKTKPTLNETIQFLSNPQVLGMDSKRLTKAQLKRMSDAYSVAVLPQTAKQAEANSKLYKSYNPIAITAVQLLNEMAGIGWTTGSHTASHVPVYAIGAGDYLFSGQLNNTDIPRRIATAMGLQVDFK
ncbi:MAG: alkaline phosphatase [Bacteroidales bacterium]|nr:alkaline phosphatase [Bacteroidales bacterium]